MEIQLVSQPAAETDCDVLAVIGFEKEGNAGGISGVAAEADRRTGGWLSELYESGEFKGKLLDSVLLHRPQGLRCGRLLVIGGGKASTFGTIELRRLAGAVVRVVKPKGCRTAALALDPPFASAGHAAAAAEGAALGDWEPDRYKTENRDEKKPVERFLLAVEGARSALEASVSEGRVVAEARNYARDLVNEPANLLPPRILAAKAREMASQEGLECEVLDREAMGRLGMGALLGVARGSQEPPALIVARYRPAAEPATAAHIGLIGKGVTFDSGGISIKPSENMEKMKYDMAGGAAVLATMRAVARLKPRVAVTAVVPAVENMPGGAAQRPGDVVTTMSGKTVEVLNTDAEGRLILADAITYARGLGCTHLVDVATLTGAIVVALGHVNIGAFSNDEELSARVLEASREAGEKTWRMPLDDDYKEALKSVLADIPNAGNRSAGAITASMFLKEFVEDTPWVHLDIAGTAWLEEATPFLAKGPSGVPVGTLARLVNGWRS